MILAAGRGERMRPLTDTCPKPLLAVGGKPLIAWHIERLCAAGIRELVVNHAHLGAMIESALGDGRDYGARIVYSAEREALETAGGIRKALPMLGEGPFAVLNADVFCDLDFHQLRLRADALAQGRDLAFLWMVPNPAHHPAGDFHLAEGRLSDAGQPRLTFSGIGIYRAELFAPVRSGDKASLAPLLRDAMTRGRVGGALHAGLWTDVGTAARLAELDQWLSSTRELPAGQDR